MKVLYIGNYKDGTGWGNAAMGNILAMQSAGIDVVARPVTYNVSEDTEVCQGIISAESNSIDDCDVVVQHVLPNYYSYNGDYRNVGYLDIESSNIRPTSWHKYCNMMDEMWVPSHATAKILVDSGVNVPIHIVPHPVRVNASANGNKIEELNSGFTFGFVGEFIERKNIKALIQAFHMEFENHEPVNLFIKTSGKTLEFAQGYFEQIKKGLRIRNSYKNEITVAGRLEENDYMSVLSQIDCFVMPSRGEAYCIPAVEAMSLGIPAIYTEGTGMDHLVGWPVRSYEAPCFGATESLPCLDTAASTWREIDLLDLCKTMRMAYDSCFPDSTLREKCVLESRKFSHHSVGQTIKEILNDNSPN